MKKIFATAAVAVVAMTAVSTTACSAEQRQCATATQMPGAPKPAEGPDGKTLPSKTLFYEVNIKLLKGVTQPTLIASDQNKVLGWPQDGSREIGVALPAGHYRVSCYSSNGNGRTNTFIVTPN